MNWKRIFSGRSRPPEPPNLGADLTESREQLLVHTLLDPEADYGDRDEAATQLSDFDGPRTRAALRDVALNETSRVLSQTAAESLSEIWCRTGEIDWDAFRQLKGKARIVVRSTLVKCRPEWAGIINNESNE